MGGGGGLPLVEFKYRVKDMLLFCLIFVLH